MPCTAYIEKGLKSMAHHHGGKGRARHASEPARCSQACAPARCLSCREGLPGRPQATSPKGAGCCHRAMLPFAWPSMCPSPTPAMPGRCRQLRSYSGWVQLMGRGLLADAVGGAIMAVGRFPRRLIFCASCWEVHCAQTVSNSMPSTDTECSVGSSHQWGKCKSLGLQDCFMHSTLQPSPYQPSIYRAQVSGATNVPHGWPTSSPTLSLLPHLK